VGLRLRADVPFDAALLARYFFRDAARRAVAQQQSRARREHWRRKAAEAARTVYAGDRVDVTLRGRVLGLRATRKGEVLRVDGRGGARVRLTSGEEREVPLGAVRLQASPSRSLSLSRAAPGKQALPERLPRLSRSAPLSIFFLRIYLQMCGDN
jgi:hypothetical protein